jgi:Xaa-Pro dipeptidase
VRNTSLDTLYRDHLKTVMRRADEALSAAGFDALVIHAGVPPIQFLDDQTYPYKVNPHFKAWVPILDNPQCVLIYVPGSRPKVLFHQPNDYWHKPASLPSEPWTEAVELVPMPDPASAGGEWAKLGRVAFVGPRDSFAADAATVNDPELLARLHFDRAVKTPYEIECLRRASDLGARGHLAALAAFRRGASEYEAHMRYLEACAQREEEMPYNNIVAYNEHAAVLHYQHLERRPPERLRSFLLDAGAQYRGYASDITRTYSAAPGLFSALIDALDAAQLRLCAEIVPGKDYREVHLSAHRILGDVLHTIGLTTLPGEAALEEGLTGVFFPHGIGHLLGLQVHDVGGVMGDSTGGERKRPEGHPYLRLTRMLEPGVVVTVEPGIYLIDSLLKAAREDQRGRHIDWAVVEQLRPFGGIRIEDNVVAAHGAPENLTRNAFARLAMSPPGRGAQATASA